MSRKFVFFKTFQKIHNKSCFAILRFPNDVLGFSRLDDGFLTLMKELITYRLIYLSRF